MVLIEVDDLNIGATQDSRISTATTGPSLPKV